MRQVRGFDAFSCSLRSNLSGIRDVVSTRMRLADGRKLTAILSIAVPKSL
jgi:hypothetical protein